MQDLPEAAQSYVTNNLLEHYSRADLEENMRALVGSLRIAKKFAICTRDMVEDGYKRSKDLADVEEVYEPFGMGCVNNFPGEVHGSDANGNDDAVAHVRYARSVCPVLLFCSAST